MPEQDCIPAQLKKGGGGAEHLGRFSTAFPAAFAHGIQGGNAIPPSHPQTRRGAGMTGLRVEKKRLEKRRDYFVLLALSYFTLHFGQQK